MKALWMEEIRGPTLHALTSMAKLPLTSMGPGFPLRSRVIPAPDCHASKFFHFYSFEDLPSCSPCNLLTILFISFAHSPLHTHLHPCWPHEYNSFPSFLQKKKSHFYKTIKTNPSCKGTSSIYTYNFYICIHILCIYHLYREKTNR